jgi:hypothetical protein
VSPEKKAAATRVENAAKPIPAWKLRYEEARLAFARKHGITTGQARMNKEFQNLYHQMERQRLRIIKALHPDARIRMRSDSANGHITIRGARTQNVVGRNSTVGSGGGGGDSSDRDLGEASANSPVLDLGSSASRSLARETLANMPELQSQMLFDRMADIFMALGLNIQDDWIYNFL